MGPESERKPLVAVGEDNGLTADQLETYSGISASNHLAGPKCFGSVPPHLGSDQFRRKALLKIG